MNAEMVTTTSTLETLCARIRAAPRIGLDTEFHNERSYTARLMVVQIAFDDGAAIVDPLAIADLSPLAIAISETLVIGHALSSDLKIFADRFDVVPPHVFDTQVAASFCGYGLAISLADLVRDLTGVRLKKSHTVSDWSTRPFSPGQLEYLIDDVAHLLEMHDTLGERLEKNGRCEWALEENQALSDPAKYRVDPRRLYMRISGANRMSRRELGVLSHLAILREKMARQRDLPLKYIMADDVLAGLATMRPKHPEDLAQLRRLDAGTRKSLGNAILEAVVAGEAIPEAELPQRPSRPLGNQREGLVSIMSVLAAAIAQQNDLPSSLLAPRAALERIAREVPPDRAALEAALDLNPWRSALIVDPLWRLLSAQAALKIEGYGNGDPRISLE
ncbi:MAG: HRDC domain-containing protein [Candidatus Eremiobacteraeota bacterium]|nr:HRDC domain-containing protein [Candidatus Eremiobacteraeota bacterium]